VSRGARVFVDQAAQDGFSADLLSVNVGRRGAGSAGLVVGDALRDALVRPRRVENVRIDGTEGQETTLGSNQSNR